MQLDSEMVSSPLIASKFLMPRVRKLEKRADWQTGPKSWSHKGSSMLAAAVEKTETEKADRHVVDARKTAEDAGSEDRRHGGRDAIRNCP
jgi:hypothetical protein